MNIYTLFDGLAYNACGYFASCERAFSNVLRISTLARLRKIAKQMSNTSKYNKSLNESKERVSQM